MTGRRIRIYRSLDEAADFGPCALTIGNFDGAHAGHRRIFRRVAEVARKNGWKASAMTFDPHPAKIVAPERAPKLLTTPDQRCALMAEEGIEQVLILPFAPNIAQLTPEEFAREILIRRLGACAVLVGDNFRFGHRHAGDTATLQKLGETLGFVTEVVPAVTLRTWMISSSVVRRLIQDGSVSKAARLLERPHFVEGDVVRGLGIGSRETVPTLNMRPAGEVMPANGVYVTRTTDADGKRRWPSVTNIGFRPTFDGSGLTVETHLLAPLTGETPGRIRVEFLRRLRAERKFADAASLKAQILADMSRAKVFFRRLDQWVANRPASRLL